jgi:hypothetical protein
MRHSLCESCRHLREVISGKGSRFLLCQKSSEDQRYPKYPPQPVLRCEGHQNREESSSGSRDGT